MKNYKRGFLVPVVIIIVVAVMGGGVYLFVKNKDGFKEGFSSVSTALWSVHTNVTDGYTFKYPSDTFGVEEEDARRGNGDHTVAIYEPKSLDKPTFAAQISVIRPTTQGVATLADVEKSLVQDLKVPSLQNRKERMLGETKAIQFHYDFPKDSGITAPTFVYIIAVANDKAYSIMYPHLSTGSKEEELFEKVVATIEFITPQVAADYNPNIKMAMTNARSGGQLIFSKNKSYVPLCSAGKINPASDPYIKGLVDYLLKEKGVQSQAEAGIICVATKDKYAISVKLDLVPQSFCIDSADVAREGIADKAAVSCK
jgi:hypothetical protein